MDNIFDILPTHNITLINESFASSSQDDQCIPALQAQSLSSDDTSLSTEMNDQNSQAATFSMMPVLHESLMFEENDSNLWEIHPSIMVPLISTEKSNTGPLQQQGKNQYSMKGNETATIYPI